MVSDLLNPQRWTCCPCSTHSVQILLPEGTAMLGIARRTFVNSKCCRAAIAKSVFHTVQDLYRIKCMTRAAIERRILRPCWPLKHIPRASGLSGPHNTVLFDHHQPARRAHDALHTVDGRMNADHHRRFRVYGHHRFWRNWTPIRSTLVSMAKHGSTVT
jgi:hypothetical protein